MVLSVAAVAKLTRNLSLAFVLPAVSYLHASEGELKTTSKVEESAGLLATFQKYVPSFLVGFVAMSALRSCGDMSLDSTGLGFGFLSPEDYKLCLRLVGDDASKYLLGIAMAGVGLGTKAEALNRVGIKPFVAGGLGTMVVGGTGLGIGYLVL